jgi:uncharacterized protein involved in exopolysaccharide biosynthesis
MATREIAKQGPQYDEPDLEPELISEAVEEPRERRRIVAKLGLLWEQRRFLYRCAAIGLVVSIIVAFVIPVRYTSTTRLMPPDQDGASMASMLTALGKGGGGLGAFGGELLGLKTSGDLFVGVVSSRTVKDDVIDKFDLRKVYGVRRYEDARRHLDGSTDVSADRKSGIITITVSDRNPDRAAGMGREYVEALNRIVITLNTSSAHKERVFLEGRLEQVQVDLETAEKDFSQFASRNTAIDVKEQGRAMIDAAALLEGQLIAAQTELEGLRQIYTPNNVRVRAVQARVDEYRRQLRKMGGKVPASAEDGTSQNEESAEQSQDSYPSIRRLPILGVTWADLERRTRVLEAVLETLTEQYELARVEEARETPSVKVLDVADVPEKKSYPPRLIVILLGTGLVFALSSVWVLAHARWQEIDPRDPGKILAQGIFQTVRTKVSGIADRVLRQSERGGKEDSPGGS